ncbi:MAG: hypothetical protein WCX71_05900 [Candidatus Buchananbacteria bacterium]
MIQIILLIIGIVALFKKSIAVSKGAELRQPKLRKFGIVTIGMVILQIVVSGALPKGTDISILMYAVTVIVPIVVAIKLKEPVSTAPATK